MAKKSRWKLETRLHKLGVCQTPRMKEILLETIGGHFMKGVVDSLRQGKKFRGTGDNWDIKVLKGQMRKDRQNDDLHLFASNLIENRIHFDHLPNDIPKANILQLPLSKYYLDGNEWRQYHNSSKILVGRILLEFLPKFKFLKAVIPDHIEHKYSDMMAKRSTIISMPIIDANEANYADCVKILRVYESWISECYCKAGFLEETPNMEYPPIPEGPAETGQCCAHTNFTENDPMKEMKVPFSGDQLTRVRFAGAKDLLADSSTPSDRFEHCSPFKPVMWHTKASLLQYSYQLLHNAESVDQIGTIKFFREKYNRRNVTPTKVVNSYEGSEELFVSVGRAYIINAAMEFFGMDSFDEKTKINMFQENIEEASNEEKLKYFDEVVGEFVDIFILQKAQYVKREEDYVRNYGLCFIFLAVLIMQMKDTAKEGDGERNLINQKILLSIFKSLGQYSRYAKEMFVSISQIEGLLTPRLAEEFKHGFFVNWRGRNGKNMEEDLAQEISNRLGKNIVQRMGPNKTISSISKICKAITGIKAIIENFDEKSGVHKPSVQHQKLASLSEEKEMVIDLQSINPFKHTPGRSHVSFQEIKRHPQRYLNQNDFCAWMVKCKHEFPI